MSHDQDDELLDPRQAGAYLNLTHRALEYRRAHDLGPPHIKLGSGKTAAVRYRRSDLDQYLRERERPTPSVATPEILMECLQRIVDICARQYGMRGPFNLVITDARGQQLGRRVGETFDRALPGYRGKLSKAYPPFSVEVTDAEGEQRAFDVGLLTAPDAKQVPDIRAQH